jgi:hypothetical protein
MWISGANVIHTCRDKVQLQKPTKLLNFKMKFKLDLANGMVSPSKTFHEATHTASAKQIGEFVEYNDTAPETKFSFQIL